MRHVRYLVPGRNVAVMVLVVRSLKRAEGGVLLLALHTCADPACGGRFRPAPCLPRSLPTLRPLMLQIDHSTVMNRVHPWATWLYNIGGEVSRSCRYRLPECPHAQLGITPREGLRAFAWPNPLIRVRGQQLCTFFIFTTCSCTGRPPSPPQRGWMSGSAPGGLAAMAMAR